MTGSLRHRLGAFALVVALLAVSPPARASDEPGYAYSATTGIGSAVATLVYAPLKIAYALGGTVVSGLAWMFTFGDTSIAGPILRSSVKGDYVVTPDHLTGERSLHFAGR